MVLNDALTDTQNWLNDHETRKLEDKVAEEIKAVKSDYTGMITSVMNVLKSLEPNLRAVEYNTLKEQQIKKSHIDFGFLSG